MEKLTKEFVNDSAASDAVDSIVLPNSRYNQNVFINTPVNPSEIIILHRKQWKMENPFLSIVIPICNQEDIIIQNICSILDKTTETTFELIIILDGCLDKTEQKITQWLNQYEEQMISPFGIPSGSHPSLNRFATSSLDDSKNIQSPEKLLTNILVLKSDIPLFETSADNLGFFCSRGKYCLEIQSDMEMTEMGYNMKLLRPFLLDNNIIGISGRCCHNFKGNRGIGKLGTNITQKLEDLPEINVNAYYIGETCNRGPLLLDKEKLKKMKYLDEVNYFLDNSEHDLFARAFVEHSWICGYVPIDFNALLENGTTRKPRDALNQLYYEKKKRDTQNGQNGFLLQHIHSIPHRDIIQYNL